MKKIVFELREKLAVIEGREKSLKDLLKITEEKVVSQSNQIQVTTTLEKNFSIAKQNNQTLIAHNKELCKKYNAVQKEYDILKEDYK